MSEQTGNSGLPMNTTIPTELVQEMDIPVAGIALEVFFEKFMNIIAPEVPLERLMDLDDLGVYGSGILEGADSVEKSYWFFLLTNFLKSLEKRENPNKFAIPTLWYICSKDPDKISRYPYDSEINVHFTRDMLVCYIGYQKNDIPINEKDVDSFLSGVKDAVGPWVHHLGPKLHVFPNDILTVQDHKPTTIKECLTTIHKDSDPETTKTALMKLYNELGIFEFKREYLHGNNLSEICDRLPSAIKGNMDFKQYLLEYNHALI